MPADQMSRDNRDLVLAPGEFAFVLDTTKGKVTVNVGPYKTSMADTDRLVVFDKAARRFVRVETLDKAIQRNSIAPEGFYLALYNPAPDGTKDHPDSGKSTDSIDLAVGHRVNIHGPADFALWPGQMYEVYRGHHLRSNQYLLAQVYNDVEATANWQHAVVKPAGAETPQTQAERTFTPGELMIIKGTDVAFFMPPTGVKVVGEKSNGAKVYVRDAVTLERLEYCILLDEDGNKRFVQGPAVVFPEPTENFVTKDEDGVKVRKFRAIELNPTTGIYVKVIAPYTEGDNTERKAGDELFITGDDMPIYFQREEHSIIRYGEQTKHYAVAIPAGEGRYVLNRQTGVIDLRMGPQMLLCDPRSEVIVRRVLSDKESTLFFPGNQQSLKVNRELAAHVAQTDPTQFSAGRTTPGALNATLSTRSAYSMLNAMDEVASASRQLAGDTFMRGNKFQPPRTLTLDTKYEGAVGINPWPGYAVLVVDKRGQRRVVLGPDTILLQYDETLAPLGLSTGKPRWTTSCSKRCTCA